MGSRTAPAAFLDGLALDRLHRSGVITFLRGLPQRTARQLGVDSSDTEEAGADPAPVSDTANGETGSGVDDDQSEHIRSNLASMTDRLDALIERLQASGYPLSSSDGGTEPDVSPGLPSSADSTWKRFAAAATEAVRWADGIPADAWIDDELMTQARAAVGELSWLLRRFEDGSADAGEPVEH